MRIMQSSAQHNERENDMRKMTGNEMEKREVIRKLRADKADLLAALERIEWHLRTGEASQDLQEKLAGDARAIIAKARGE